LVFLLQELLAPAVFAKNEVTRDGRDIPVLDEFFIPIQEGSVREYSGEHQNESIIIVQDFHGNEEVQKNCAAILRRYRNWLNGKDFLISTEGAAGFIDYSVPASMPEAPIREKVFSILLRDGQINGAEYYAITRKDPVLIYGAEDEAAYVRNLELYRKAQRSLSDIRNTLAPLKELVRSMRRSTCSDPVNRLIDAKEAFDENRTPLPEYLRVLETSAQSSGVDLGPYPNIGRMIFALQKEKDLSMPSIDAERDALMKELGAKGGAECAKEIAVLSVRFRMGNISPHAFYARIIDLAADSGLHPDGYPALKDYLRFLNNVSQINRDALAVEMRTLAETVIGRMEKDVDGRVVETLDRRVVLLERLVTLTLSREELAAVLAGEDTGRADRWASFLSGQIRPLIEKKAGGDAAAEQLRALDAFQVRASALFDAAESAQLFYRGAGEREESIVTNTIARMREHNVTYGAITAGGFHLGGITALLRERGISFVVVTPTCTDPGAPNPYHAIMTGAVPGIDRWFMQHLGTIAIPSILAERSFFGEKARDALFCKMIISCLEKKIGRRENVGEYFKQWLGNLSMLLSAFVEKSVIRPEVRGVKMKDFFMLLGRITIAYDEIVLVGDSICIPFWVDGEDPERENTLIVGKQLFFDTGESLRRGELEAYGDYGGTQYAIMPYDMFLARAFFSKGGDRSLLSIEPTDGSYKLKQMPEPDLWESALMQQELTKRPDDDDRGLGDHIRRLFRVTLMLLLMTVTPLYAEMNARQPSTGFGSYVRQYLNDTVDRVGAILQEAQRRRAEVEAERKMDLAIQTYLSNPLNELFKDFTPPVTGQLSSGFGKRTHPIRRTTHFHDGVDIKNQEWTPVFAPWGGKVIKIVKSLDEGYGNHVIIETVKAPGVVLRSLSGHLTSIYVREGEEIAPGARIGGMGTTGVSTGDHLHFTVWMNGKLVNPLLFFDAKTLSKWGADKNVAENLKKEIAVVQELIQKGVTLESAITILDQYQEILKMTGLGNLQKLEEARARLQVVVDGQKKVQASVPPVVKKGGKKEGLPAKPAAPMPDVDEVMRLLSLVFGSIVARKGWKEAKNQFVEDVLESVDENQFSANHLDQMVDLVLAQDRKGVSILELADGGGSTESQRRDELIQAARDAIALRALASASLSRNSALVIDAALMTDGSLSSLVSLAAAQPAMRFGIVLLDTGLRTSFADMRASVPLPGNITVVDLADTPGAIRPEDITAMVREAMPEAADLTLTPVFSAESLNRLEVADTRGQGGLLLTGPLTMSAIATICGVEVPELDEIALLHEEEARIVLLENLVAPSKPLDRESEIKSLEAAGRSL